ncbi:hypothetical protein A2U01_0008269, partial [Trifolium medium]|nr:hypothetical protein [Trifolium medium]
KGFMRLAAISKLVIALLPKKLERAEVYGLLVGYTPPRYVPPPTEGSTIGQVIQVLVGNNTKIPASQPRARQAQPWHATPQESLYGYGTGTRYWYSPSNGVPMLHSLP